MSDAVRRIVSAVVGIPVLALIIGLGRPWHFFLMMIAVASVALWEYFAMISSRPLAKILGVASGLGMFVGAVRSGASVHASLAAVLLIGALWIILMQRGNQPGERGRFWLAWSLLGILYIGYLFPHWIFLYESPVGRRWVFFILVVVMTGDTAGYLVGKRFGRRKIYPRISPGKTLEGTVAVIVAGVLAGLLANRLFLLGLPVREAFVLSLLLSLLGQGGDLFESWIKRSFGVKDSGAFIPGHGGILDRMDSLVFPAVLSAHYVRWFHS
jgi:phosphatidate cytidylyltransferase